MAQVILTLQIPRGGRGIPVATTSNPDVLRYFKDAVIQEWQVKTKASDDIEAMLARLELDRLRKALGALIPDTPEGYSAN